MTSESRSFRVFLSSPGDVASERTLARQLLERLPFEPDFHGKLSLDVIAWDAPDKSTPMLATLTPQEAINRQLPTPSQCDVVIVIFWSRMGTPLPAEYVKADNTPYLSGTEWEYWDAYNAAVKTGKPLMIVYRRMEDPLISLRDAHYKEKMTQYERLDSFFAQFIGPSGELLHGHNQYNTPEDFRVQLEIHMRKLLTRLLESPDAYDIAKPPARPVFWDKSPFPGLRAFTREDAPIFFGRGHETNGLLKQVSSQRFVGVVGSSGSGKSSLVGAGLVPQLAGNAIEGSKDWKFVRFTPGATQDKNPFTAMADALKPFLEGISGDEDGLANMLMENSTAINGIADRVLESEPEWAELMFFIDQFEELFTLVEVQHVEKFVGLLEQITLSKRVRAVVTMRADFYDRCVEYPLLARLLEQGTFPLSAPSPEALMEMIVRPAGRAGLIFEEGLPLHILTEMGTSPGALALMAYTLDELYQRSRVARQLTYADYEALGGVKGAIGTRAENIYSQLDEKTQQAAWGVFRELIDVDERGRITRRRVPLHEFDQDGHDLITAFIKARLLIASAEMDRTPLVEVAHEALLTNWKRLVEWIEGMQSELYLLHQIRRDAALWADSGYLESFLWTGDRLHSAREMATRSRPRLSAIETDFLRSEIERLEEKLTISDLDHMARLHVGDRLRLIGDTRCGVGLSPNGIPDVCWLPVEPGVLILETGEHQAIAPFYIAKYLVTHLQFQAFLESESGWRDERWWHGLQKHPITDADFGFSNHPRDSVNWFEAVAFSRWMTHLLQGTRLAGSSAATDSLTIGEKWCVRLPTQWEWQWAATMGQDSYVYPWGAEWDSARANTRESLLMRTTAVGMYPHGASATGALDMAGNLWEWCLDEPALSPSEARDEKPVRGGSWYSLRNGARSLSRYKCPPAEGDHSRGFRLIAATILSES